VAQHHILVISVPLGIGVDFDIGIDIGISIDFDFVVGCCNLQSAAAHLR
jgi:hypothetical protein